MLSSHVIYMPRGSPGILHGHSLSHYWECIYPVLLLLTAPVNKAMAPPLA